MDFLGEIKAVPDPPGIDNEQWVEFARGHKNLVPPPPVVGINPFTKKPMLIQPPHPGCAYRVVVGGNTVGQFSWAENGENAVPVFGDREVMIPFAVAVAAYLGASFDQGRPS